MNIHGIKRKIDRLNGIKRKIDRLNWKIKQLDKQKNSLEIRKITQTIINLKTALAMKRNSSRS